MGRSRAPATLLTPHRESTLAWGAVRPPPPLTFVDFLREFAKFLGLFVTRLYLQLRELARFLARQQRNQSLKLNCTSRAWSACFNIKCSNFRTDSL